MAEFHVGILGAKFAGTLHAESYRRLPGVKIVAAADQDPAALAAFCDKYGLEERYASMEALFARPGLDLVSICLPNFLHHEAVLKGAAAGCNLVVEKPLATTVADGERMLEAVRRAGVRLFYAEDWIFAPALARAREILAEGGIGRLLYLKAKEVHNGSHSPFAQKKEYCGGGALFHLGIHPLGWVMTAAGASLVEVLAATTAGGEGNLVHSGYTGEDWGVGILRFANGVRALIEGNYLTVGGMDDVVEVYGTDGVLKVDLSFGSPIRCYSRRGIGYAVEKADFTHGWTRPAVDEFESLGYRAEIAHFIECVKSGRPAAPGCRPEDGLRFLRAALALYQSAQSGKAVVLKEDLPR